MIKRILILLTIIFLIPVGASQVFAQDIPPSPDLDKILDSVANPDQISVGILILIVLTLLSLAPALVMMFTTFIRIIIVLSFTRTALATQSMPPFQVLVGIALFMTFFIMAPQFQQIYQNAWVPYQKKEIGTDDLLERSVEPIREFMLAQMRNDEGRRTIALFINLGKIEAPSVEEDIPTYVIIPAFMINELRISFEMGVLIFIPFIIIDVIIASVLLSMGLIFLPPVLVSLPFKMIVFVLVDGWRLLTETLIRSFNVPG